MNGTRDLLHCDRKQRDPDVSVTIVSDKLSK